MDKQSQKGHRLKFLQATNAIAGNGLKNGGRMWIQSVEEGTSYGGMSKDGDVVIINDYGRDTGEDLAHHFASVKLDSIESEYVNVVETESGIMVFTPTEDAAIGVWGSCVMPVTLPSLDGIMESTAKHSIRSGQVAAVNRAFSFLSASYHCIPVTLGTKPHLAFTAKGRKWDIVVLCMATNTTESIVDALSRGWINAKPRAKAKSNLTWEMIPKSVRRLMAIELGLTRRRMTAGIEEKLLEIEVSTAFKALSLDCIYEIGGKIGMNNQNATAKTVLKALMDNQGMEKSS